MDSNIVVAVITAAATVAAALITAYAQRQVRPTTADQGSRPEPTRSATAPRAAQTGDPPREQQRPSADEPVQEEEEALALEAGSKLAEAEGPAAELVCVPCPACHASLRIRSALWLKRVRCNRCQTLFKPSPVPGTSVIVKRGLQDPNQPTSPPESRPGTRPAP